MSDWVGYNNGVFNDLSTNDISVFKDRVLVLDDIEDTLNKNTGTILQSK